MNLRAALTLAIAFSATAHAQKTNANQLRDMAQRNDPALVQSIRKTFGVESLTQGTAWSSNGPHFFFALASDTPAQLVIDNAAPLPMQHLANSDIYIATADIPTLDALHQFHYLHNGSSFGGVLDLPAYGPTHYPDAQTPRGTLSPQLHHVSKIYDGMPSDYWIYVPAQYSPKKPAALMVFNDGHNYIAGRKPGDKENAAEPNTPSPLNVIDHLIAQGKMPVTICVLINPGDVTAVPNTPTHTAVQAYAQKWSRTVKDSTRSVEYDTVSDRYSRFLRDELLPEVEKQYALRHDGYSRAITGSSSGGIAAFNAAWQMPDQFSRVLSWIGTYTSIQWHEDPTVPDGGQDYPEKVLHEPHRNLRVWLQDGSNDQENPRYGSWPLANLKMANALKQRGYDFHLSFAHGTHNGAHGKATLPQALTWLWRDYNAAQTSQTYKQDPAEKDQPPFRVQTLNRETN